MCSSIRHSTEYGSVRSSPHVMQRTHIVHRRVRGMAHSPATSPGSERSIRLVAPMRRSGTSLPDPWCDARWAPQGSSWSPRARDPARPRRADVLTRERPPGPPRAGPPGGECLAHPPRATAPVEGQLAHPPRADPPGGDCRAHPPRAAAPGDERRAHAPRATAPVEGCRARPPRRQPPDRGRPGFRARSRVVALAAPVAGAGTEETPAGNRRTADSPRCPPLL